MDLEKIVFDDLTYVWKTKLGLLEHKKEIIDKSFEWIQKFHGTREFDNYGYKYSTDDYSEKNNMLDVALSNSLNICNHFYKKQTNIKCDDFIFESWINITRSNGKIKTHIKDGDNPLFHNHVHINQKRINKNEKTFIPEYIFVYYIQMPDIMEKEDGALYILGKDNKIHWIRPEEDDLFIMKGDVPHAPNDAPLANIDRIVLAGNLKFISEKKQTTLI